MEPLVSVIIPVYNVVNYLREAVDSIINQTYNNLEIILVDDGSIDGSATVCDQYLYDSRVTVVHQENKGLSGARNTGLDIMTGEYVAFLDSDDAFYPEMIQTMITEIKDNEADLVVCGFYSYRTEKGLLSRTRQTHKGCYFKKERISGAEALKRLFFGEINYAVWNKIYCRKLWEGLRFSEGRVYEDVQVMYELLGKCKKVLLLPEIMVAYRIRTDSITKTASIQNVKDYLYSQQLRAVQMEKCVPDRFSEEELKQFEEVQLRSLIRQYSQWMTSHPDKESKAVLEETRTQIKQKRGRIQLLSFKTRIMYQLCMISPYGITLLSPIYNAFRRFSRIL